MISESVKWLAALLVGAAFVILGMVWRVVLISVLFASIFAMLYCFFLYAIGPDTVPHVPFTVAFLIILVIACLPGL